MKPILMCLLVVSVLVGVVALLYGYRRRQINLAFDRQRDIFTRPILEQRPLRRKEDLPIIIQRWLDWSGIDIQKPRLVVFLQQDGEMRLKPEQVKTWKSRSRQIISIQQSGFVWLAYVRAFGLPLIVEDTLLSGKASTSAAFLGFIPLARVANDPKLNQSALQRYLGEIIWLPYAALDPVIEWKAVDDTTARAKIKLSEVEADMTFHFLPSGEPEKVTALRFKEVQDTAATPWIAEIRSTRIFKNVRVPETIRVSWELPEGRFSWFDFRVVDLRFY